MIPHIRQQFNQAFTEENYQKVLSTLRTKFNPYQEEPTFKVAETPIFLPPYVKQHLINAVSEISDVLAQPDFKKQSEAAIIQSQYVPNEDPHSLFIQLDFGICSDGNGGLIPQMIELQGFPSLYFFQNALASTYREHYSIPANMTNFFNGYNQDRYVALLQKVIVGNHNPENVVLLEIEPEKQNTRIDFWYTQHFLGIKVLCLSKLLREGRDLYYINEQGKKIAVHRIYNRVIFDELIKRDDLQLQFNLTEDVDVEWAGHPNWFMRISKYTLPFLKNKYVPETYFLHELESYPDDLENYVLKPIYSFSGLGVKIHINKEDLDSITDNRNNYILQKKVNYEPVIETLDEKAKCEVRMMLIWDENEPRPMLVNNLVRMSKGEMVGVRYNKNKTWVGGSVSFFEP